MGDSSAASKAAWQPPGVDPCQRFPELPVPGFQHRNRAVTGPDRRLFLLTHDRSTAPRWRPCCGVAVIGTSARCPGASSWTRGKCRQRVSARRRLRGRRTVSLQFTSESVRWWNRCGPANCRHRRSNGSSDETTVWSWGAANGEVPRGWCGVKEGCLETTQPCACGKPRKTCCARSHDPGMHRGKARPPRPSAWRNAPCAAKRRSGASACSRGRWNSPST